MVTVPSIDDVTLLAEPEGNESVVMTVAVVTLALELRMGELITMQVG